MTSLHSPFPDLLYIFPHFEWPETPNIFSTGSIGILSFKKILSSFSKFQAFAFKKNTPGFHMPFSRIIYILSVQCPLSHLMTQMGLLIYLWGTWVAGLPVLPSSLQVLWFLPFFPPQFLFYIVHFCTGNTYRASIPALVGRYFSQICSGCSFVILCGGVNFSSVKKHNLAESLLTITHYSEASVDNPWSHCISTLQQFITLTRNKQGTWMD